MKSWHVAPVCAFLSLITASCGGAEHAATISEERQIIETYPFGDPDPVPILAASRNAAIYPYFRFDGFTNESRDQEWKVLRLENDFIRVFVLPEAGGKIWGAIEKSSGRDFIYRNAVMKFRDVAMRGPWTSGGIEFNFGLIGHTPATATPVDYVTKENADGSVSCIVGSMDLPSRTQWRVEIRLPKDAAYFETRSFWYNPTPLQQSYYHWMNAAVHAREDLQFFYPGRYYIGHGGDAHPWPVNENGIDLSLYRNHHFGGHKSLHVLGSNAEFSGGYWHQLGLGFGHWSRYDDLPGRKIWIWSLSRSGAIWEDLLTDESGQYVEVQAGRQFSQATLSSGGETPFTQAAFAPYAADSWRELWFPVREIGGIVAANPDGALNVIRKGDEARIAFNALKPVRSELTVIAGSATVLHERLNLSPMQVYAKQIVIPQAEEDIRVLLGNRLFWHSLSDPNNQFVRDLVSPPEKGRSTAGKAYLLGRQHELMRDYVRAREDYKTCINGDPLHISAMIRLAEINYRQWEYGEALKWAKKALAIDTYHPAANFLCATVLRQLESPAAAREALSWAARSLEYRSAAYSMIAEIHLGEGRFEEAVEYALRALEFNQANISALSALALAQRKMDRREQASKAQAEILRLDPISHFAASEEWLLNPSEESQFRLTSSIRGELPHEGYLELAAYYSTFGLEQEAIGILRLSPSHPMVNYWLAYLNRMDSPDTSRTYLDKAVQASPMLVYPFRDEDVSVLAWALNQDRDWKARYYLGLLAWSRGLHRKAANHLSECGSEPDYGPFYIARAELLKKSGQAPPEEDYRRALDLAPGEWRAWLALARFHSEHSSLQEALEVARAGFDRFPENFILGMESAKAMIDNSESRDALDVLDRLAVLPYENASEGRILYEKAHLLLAGEKIGAGNFEEALVHIRKSRDWPENLGAGKPYDPDERLQDFLEYYCGRELGRNHGGAAGPAEIRNLKAELKRASTWKYNLITTISR